MRKKLTKWALAACALTVSAAVHAAGPSAAMLANACAGCHGTNGVSAGPSMPNLAGQSRVFFTEAMKKFKSGERESTVMGRLAKGYSDDQIAALADYFAKQKPQPQSTAVDPVLAAKGKEIYTNSCKRCHIDNGKDFDEDVPIVAGQWLKYLQIQMDDFTSGKRKMSEKKAEKVKSLTRADWEAVAHFYASQK